MNLFVKAQLAGQKVKARANEIMKNPKGMTMVEIVVVISVVLVFATVLGIFGGNIKAFLTRAGGSVNNLAVQ